MKIFKRICGPVAGFLILAACAGTPDASNQTNLTICVISGEPADGGPTVEYMGRQVSFCCNNCKRKWDKMDDSARKAALASMASESNS